MRSNPLTLVACLAFCCISFFCSPRVRLEACSSFTTDPRADISPPSLLTCGSTCDSG